MNSMQFTSRIENYLLNQEKTLDQALLEEASNRCAHSFKRQLMEPKMEGKLRLSSAGQCVRKSWYSHHKFEPEQMAARTHMVFLFGDVIEVAASVLGRLAGWKLLGKPEGEDRVSISIDLLGHRGEPPQEPVQIDGHIDDLLQDEETGKLVLVEYKSQSPYSYEDFEKNGLDDTWNYATQCSLYCEALGIDEYILVAINKATGAMCDRVYRKSDELVEKAKEKLYRVLNNDDMPERGFDPVDETVYNRKTKERDPTGRQILCINCAYCGFRQTCYPQAQTEIKSGRPVFVIPSTIEMPV